jgi:hypothetical protein
MDHTLLKKARDEWDAGRPLEAGRLIYEDLSPEERPGWAAAALELVRPRFTSASAASKLGRWNGGGVGGEPRGEEDMSLREHLLVIIN